MLFNSYVFVLVFLPVVLAGYHVLRNRAGLETAIAWLVLASLFFYGYWKLAYLPLLAVSVLVNFACGRLIARRPDSRPLLIGGIAFNLGLLGYFKYAGFLSFNFTQLTGIDATIEGVVLPIAISFFTFQQIAYLVDVHRGEAREYRFLHYCLFVTFFPQLIAGPIVHHAEMMPQFLRRHAGRRWLLNLATGISIFILGLFKKAVIADSVAAYASPVFRAAEEGAVLTFLEAWSGALAYTFQLYFDFSGYSDMAIGLALMFGIRLPLNFNSPYKSRSIIEFWRCWHMTLSRFLRDYLYIPLGGNRHGRWRRHVNLMITMLLGGLWHGAGWTFVIWGALHGGYLVLNHFWRHLCRQWPPAARLSSVPGWSFFCLCLTFLLVVIAWVPFRAETLEGAGAVLAGMAGLNGIAVPELYLVRFGESIAWLGALGITFDATPLFYGLDQVAVLGALLAMVWLLPNSQEVFSDYQPALGVYRTVRRPRRLRWRPEPRWAMAIALLGAVSLVALSSVSEFLYYQF